MKNTMKYQDIVLHGLEEFSFSHEASLRAIDARLAGQYCSQSSIVQVLEATKKNQRSLGILPFENSDAGVVWPHLDALRSGQFSIVGEVRHAIFMCAGVHPNQQDKKNFTVCSHPKALEQSSNFIADKQRKDSFASTAQAAEYVSTNQDFPYMALGTRQALVRNDLKIVHEDVTNLPASRNITRFFLMKKNGKNILPDSKKLHHALLLDLPDYPGSLVDALQVLRSGASLSSIHSRSVGHLRYQFFMQLQKTAPVGDVTSRFSANTKALENIVGKENIRWLGSWDDCLEPQVSEVSVEER